jgi:hypothetical protein
MKSLTHWETLVAKDLKALNTHYQGVCKGTNRDYITVYRDFCRHDGNWDASKATKLYDKHSCEYCALLEILNWHYKSHILNQASA